MLERTDAGRYGVASRMASLSRAVSQRQSLLEHVTPVRQDRLVTDSQIFSELIAYLN